MITVNDLLNAGFEKQPDNARQPKPAGTAYVKTYRDEQASVRYVITVTEYTLSEMAHLSDDTPRFEAQVHYPEANLPFTLITEPSSVEELDNFSEKAWQNLAI